MLGGRLGFDQDEGQHWIRHYKIRQGGRWPWVRATKFTPRDRSGQGNNSQDGCSWQWNMFLGQAASCVAHVDPWVMLQAAGLERGAAIACVSLRSTTGRKLCTVYSDHA